MNFHAKALYMQLSRNQGQTYQIFFSFFLCLDGIQDGFVISFRKMKYLYFQLEIILRLLMIFKKCIRIVKGTSNLTSTMVANFVIRRLYRYSYKMCSILRDAKNVCIYSKLKLSFVELPLNKIPFIYISFSEKSYKVCNRVIKVSL